MRILPVLFLLALLGQGCNGCKKAGADDALSYIPANVTAVARLDLPAMMAKADFESMKEMEFYREQIKSQQNPALQKVMENPEISGIDLNKPLYFFYLVNEENIQEGLSGVLFSMADKGAFEKLITEANIGDPSNQDGFSSVLIDKQKLAAWNEEIVLFGATDQFLDLNALAGQVFSTKASSSAANNKELQAVFSSRHDISFWITSNAHSNSPQAQLAFSMMELNPESLKDNYVNGYVDFLEGSMTGAANLEVQDELEKEISRLFRDQPQTDFSNHIPGEKLNWVFAAALNPQGVEEILASRKQSKGFIDFTLQEYGLTLTDIAKAIGGDVAMASYAAQDSLEVGLAILNIGDRASLDKLLQAAERYEVLRKIQPDYYAVNPGSMGKSAFLNMTPDSSGRMLLLDDKAYFSGDEELLRKIAAGGFEKADRLNAGLLESLNKNLFYGFFTTQRANPLAGSMENLSAFENMEFRVNKNRIEFNASLEDKSINALKAFVMQAEVSNAPVK